MRSATPILAFAVLLTAAACVEERSLDETVSSFQVELTGEVGGPTSRLAFPEQPEVRRITVTALTNKGNVATDFDGPVELEAPPGRLATMSGDTPVRLELENGVGSIEVQMSRIYGRTHLCAVDRARFADSTYAVGCSESMYFEMPSIRQVQQTRDGATSALEGSYLEIRSGDMIVTAVTPSGFFVTDLDEGRGNWDSLYVYNYSYPEGLSVGDRLESVTGTCAEFIGSTQLSFPSWVRREGPPRPEDVPAPTEISTAICDGVGGGDMLCGYSTTNLLMEALEGGLVAVRDAAVPERWIDCDLNNDGEVPNYEGSCDPSDERNICRELYCKADCNADPSCTELSSYATYGQWSVALNGGAGPKINVLTRDGFPEFDPMAEENRGRLIDVVGTLTHSLPARPRWIVSARTADDVTLH